MRAMIALDGGPADHDIVAAAAFVLKMTRDQVSLLMVVHPREVEETPAATAASSFVPTPLGTPTGVPLPRPSPLRHTAEDRDQAVERVHADRIAYLDSLGARHLGEFEFDVRIEIDEDPAATIVRFIEQHGIEGMAMGTRGGRSRLGSALFGSVSEEVIRRVDIPVLVVKEGTFGGGAPDGGGGSV